MIKILKKQRLTAEHENLITDESALKSVYRERRQILLNAFDVYSKNVVYGVETETESEHAAIVAWRQKLLNLDKTAFTDVPDRVQYYMSDNDKQCARGWIPEKKI